MNRRNAISSQSEYSVIQSVAAEHSGAGAAQLNSSDPAAATSHTDTADRQIFGDTNYLERNRIGVAHGKRPYSESLTNRIEHLSQPNVEDAARELERKQVAEVISQLDGLLHRNSDSSSAINSKAEKKNL